MNSRLIPAAAAMVSVYDRGFAYGDTLIETMKILRGQPVFLHEHFQRLRRAMGQAGFEATLDSDGLRNQAVSLAAANEVREGRLRIQLSRGIPPGTAAGVDPGIDLTPTLLLTAEPFSGYQDELYREGVFCETVAANRGRYAGVKSGSLLTTIIARREAIAAGAWETIFTSGHGRLLEGSFTNIFFLCGERLLTAGEDRPILPGVAREKVIGIAGEMGVEVRFEAPKITELRSGEDSALLTSSLLGVCPIREIDGLKLRMGRELCAQIAERLRELELADIEKNALD